MGQSQTLSQEATAKAATFSARTIAASRKAVKCDIGTGIDQDTAGAKAHPISKPSVAPVWARDVLGLGLGCAGLDVAGGVAVDASVDGFAEVFCCSICAV
jgi:hypothetical protein